MKRFASHYLLLPNVGWARQQVVEITGEGIVQRVFPLTEEIESVEWMPGAIVLLPVARKEEMEELLKETERTNVPFLSSQMLEKSFSEKRERGEELLPVWLYPFDFTSMRPVGGTRHRLLR